MIRIIIIVKHNDLEKAFFKSLKSWRILCASSSGCNNWNKRTIPIEKKNNASIHPKMNPTLVLKVVVLLSF